MNNKFRSSIGSRYLKGLFYEEGSPLNKDSFLYTLKDKDTKGYPSLYRLYMEKEDLTEWEFANEYLDGFEHWEMLCACNWFKPYVERWRRELELKLRARALSAIRDEATSESKNSYYANKFLLEGGWKEKSSTSNDRGRGRPKKLHDEQDKILE